MIKRSGVGEAFGLSNIFLSFGIYRTDQLKTPKRLKWEGDDPRPPELGAVLYWELI